MDTIGAIVLLVGIIGCHAWPSFSSRPIILTEHGKSEIIVDSEKNLTLLCEGTEKVTWTYPNNTIEGVYWSNIEVETSEKNGKYYAKLILTNASYVDVDYYHCHADTAPKDDELRSAKIYVYVRDPERLSALPVEIVLFLSVFQYDTVVLPCRPTAPDVTVTLMDSNNDEINIEPNPFVGYSFKVESLLHTGNYKCIFNRDTVTEELDINLYVGKRTESAPKPYIDAPFNGQTKIGDTYKLNCSVAVEQNVFFTLDWLIPDQDAIESGRISYTKAKALEMQGIRQGVSTLTITKVRRVDAGEYTCIITDHTKKSNNSTKNISVYGEDESYLTLKEESNMNEINTIAGSPSVQFVVVVESFPIAAITWSNNRKEEIISNTKYTAEFNPKSNKATLKISHVTLNDSGIYVVEANNGKTFKNLNFTLVVQDRPTVHIDSSNYHVIGKNTTLACTAAGFPIPTIEWFFKPCQNDACKFRKLPKSMSSSTIDGLRKISNLTMNATVTGLIKCEANNSLDNDSYTEGFFLTDPNVDVNEGTIIWSSEKHDQIATGSKVELYCAVSKYNYTNDLEWYYENNNERYPITSDKKFKIKKNITPYTYRSTLIIDSVNKTDTKNYLCLTKSLDMDLEVPLLLSVIVKDPIVPYINYTNMNNTAIKMKPGHPLKWHCFASGIPTPTIKWKKNDIDLAEELTHNHWRLSDDNSVLDFSFVQDEDAGTYSCEARNSKGVDRKTMKLEIIGRSDSTTIIIILAILGSLFIVLISVLVVRIKKERKLRRELKIAGLNNFEKGALESLNPDLGIDEQAELLPYDKKWEFPRDKLKLGKQLGSGAFGVVMKAEAFGIMEGETISTVAVKMVKRNADYTFIKALASELKIMVHLGKHLNVVNLLGACTKNVTKRELLVIVEYCRFGNLHNYLLRHRDDFVNQIDPKTGQIDTAIGQELLNRTLSIASNQSSAGRSMAFAGVDYRATPNISCTTDSTVVCSPSGEDTMILSNNSSIQPEWRSNYRGDYKGNVRPTSTHDLLCWAFQIARGMEYLSSRKVMHGDLAARNILLAEDNIVKICDFGLAKSMYKSDNYKKKGDGPLPVKWMAVESIRDRVFSTQSDVWSFGIVLWEFFSLARTPYPGMDADERMYNKLVDGYRMDQPEFATKEIYQIMLECWHAKPVYRPSFTKLADDLGNMLQEVVKKHYIDLNDPYIMMNNELLAGRSDYLAMACAPDYGNLASPGHEYVNGKLIPEDQQTEASGYLPMDIFSPRSNDSIFSFEVGKNKNLDGEPATGVELLPILHSTESDSETSPSPTKSFSNPNYHNSNSINSPKKDSIVSSSDNYINMPQQKSVINKNTDSFSNPSYIHMDNKNINIENDKNNYVNSHSRDWERPVV